MRKYIFFAVLLLLSGCAVRNPREGVDATVYSQGKIWTACSLDIWNDFDYSAGLPESTIRILGSDGRTIVRITPPYRIEYSKNPCWR